MRTRLLPAIAALATVALVATGCSGDDDDDDAAETSETTAAPEGDGGDEAADLEVEDQTGDGATVTVAAVTLPTAGFIAVHGDADGSPGPVVGHSDLLPAGESTDVTITLDEPLTASATLWPMVHVDANGNGTYDFAPPDVTDDGPATFADGDVAVLPLEYTVEG
jgi:hypothetical protein